MVEKLVDLVGRLKAYRAAWAEFCKLLSLDPSKTRFAYHDESAGFVEPFNFVEVDTDYQIKLLSSLCDAWQLRMSRS